MTPFAALVGGGGGGLGGAWAAHVLVTLANRWTDADSWLKGPNGPPFFNISLFMGVLYLGVALGLRRPRRDLAAAFLGPFLGIAVPMATLTRVVTWGAPAASGEVPPSGAWVNAVLVVFILAVWGTIAGLGYLHSRWRGAAGAVGGAFGAYLLLSLLTAAAPGLVRWPWGVGRLLPQPSVLLDGLFTGLGMGLGLCNIFQRDS